MGGVLTDMKENPCGGTWHLLGVMPNTSHLSSQYCCLCPAEQSGSSSTIHYVTWVHLKLFPCPKISIYSIIIPVHLSWDKNV